MNKIAVLLKQILSEKELPTNYVRFYVVGLLLFAIPYTRPLFIHMIAISIVLVVAAALYHHQKWTKTTIYLFSFIAFSSFFLEVAGTSTGKIFGAYQYDTGLGIKVLETPIIIGFNWVFLVYASQAIVSRITNRPLFKIIGGALLMVVYDVILEFAAPFMQMWHFESFYPPINNFIVWFLVAAFYHSCMVICKISVDNKPICSLFWIQSLFFALITAIVL
ncbi:MAG: hypothetical protein RL662_2340 [Bacteroidota bacterium]|jgi:putative membrane protein